MAARGHKLIDVAVSLVLVVAAVGVSYRMRLGLEPDLGIAVARALVQLAAMAAVINVVFKSLGWSALLLFVMLGAAAWTSARRLSGVHNAPILAALAIGLSSGIALIILFGLNAFELEPQFLIPIAGMLIGNTMTATSLAGSRLRDDVTSKTLEVEARLALGVPATVALQPYVRTAATTSLIPTIDATKNAGLIFLPGAFVGMIISGATPREAAEVQLIVLFMLLGAVAIAGMTAARLVARSFVGAGERVVLRGS